MNHDAQLVPIASLKPYPGNARIHDIDVIRESLRLNGQYRPVVVRSKTRHVLAGNGTLEAAVLEGLTEIWATFVDVDARKAKRINLVDNRANDLAGWDEQLLAAQLESLPALEGTGWDQRELVSFMARVNAPEPGADTAPGEPPAKPKTKPGELWLLGEHRLVCGDSTVAGDVEKLMGGGVAEMMWADPPYGVDYVGKTKRGLTIASDTREDLSLVLIGAWQTATAALSEGAPFYVMGPQGPGLGTTLECLRRAGWHLHQGLVWVKDQFVLGHSDYHYRHEPILYGWVPGPGRSGRGSHAGTRWCGDNAQTSVFEIPRPARSESHPTMKPVELVERCVANSSPRGAGVLDPFAGSGTTIIACENLSRRCFAMEIDPGYCDVIVDRWERHTGGKARRADRSDT